jgi:hypothetical protein
MIKVRFHRTSLLHRWLFFIRAERGHTPSQHTAVSECDGVLVETPAIIIGDIFYNKSYKVTYTFISVLFSRSGSFTIYVISTSVIYSKILGGKRTTATTQQQSRYPNHRDNPIDSLIYDW